MNKYFMEIIPNTGGKDSSMWGNTLYNQYICFFKKKKISFKTVSKKKNKIILCIKGKNIFSILKNENGIHKMIRNSPSKKKEVVHTSTCVIKTYEKEPEEKINLYKKDIKIDTFKSSGSGGQNVNKTNSAVRITHIKTGIKVECQKERSQLANKKIAMNILYSKIVESEQNKIKPVNNITKIIRLYYLNKSLVVNTINKKKTVQITRVLKGELDLLK